eukprot:6629629-Pyramimonas_sp.AAC.1
MPMHEHAGKAMLCHARSEIQSGSLYLPSQNDDFPIVHNARVTTRARARVRASHAAPTGNHVAKPC